jgi:hypothetical protein
VSIGDRLRGWTDAVRIGWIARRDPAEARTRILVARGIADAERYLGAYAAFARYVEERGSGVEAIVVRRKERE